MSNRKERSDMMSTKSSVSSRSLWRDVTELWQSSESRHILILALASLFCWIFLVYCVSVSRSLVLTGAAWLIVFAIFSLASALVSIVIRTRRPTSSYSFGLARAPVLAVFSSTVLVQLSSIFLIKESIERLVEGGNNDHSHSHDFSLFIPGTLVATAVQLVTAYGVRNEPFKHVLTASASSWLQEHAADLSQALCHVVPGLSRFLLPRLNPLGLLSCCACICCLVTNYLLIGQNIWWADCVGALFLSVAVIGTMWPLSTYTGRILLQTSPPHVLNQLDRCLREAGTLDGVLELRNGHFWQLDFNQMTGTVEVRVRRDAEEHLVLAHVTEKLSGVVSNLTVQVVKDADLHSLHAWKDADLNQVKNKNRENQHHGHSHDNGGHGHSHEHEDHGHSHEPEGCTDQHNSNLCHHHT